MKTNLNLIKDKTFYNSKYHTVLFLLCVVKQTICVPSLIIFLVTSNCCLLKSSLWSYSSGYQSREKWNINNSWLIMSTNYRIKWENIFICLTLYHLYYLNLLSFNLMSIPIKEVSGEPLHKINLLLVCSAMNSW